MNDSLRSLDIVLESYESLGARLLFLCKEQYGNDVNIRVIVAFSDQDTGRGSAILWLIKHFGVMPVEMAKSDGRVDLREFTESSPFPGLTLIIQSVPLIECDAGVKKRIPSSSENGIFDLNTITNLKAHIPYLNGLSATLVKATTDKLLQQIEVLNQFLANNSKNNLVGPVIYLTELSLPEVWAESESFPSSSFDVMPYVVTSKWPPLTAAQANTQVEFDRAFRIIVQEPAYKNKKILFISGLNVDISPEEGQPFPLTKFIPWAAYVQDKNGNHQTWEQAELYKRLQAQSTENPDQVELETIIDIMENWEEIRLPF